MDFYAILDQVIAVLRQRQRVTYRALKRQFNFDEDYREDVKAELIKGQRLAMDEDGEVLVWTGEASMTPAPAPHVPPTVPPPAPQADHSSPEASLPTSRSVPDAERRQLTVLFCDL